MWFLYILNRENNYNGEVYRRLRVNGSYTVSTSKENVEAFILKMGGMPQDKVENINFRPTVTLIKQGDVEIKVDDNVVTDPEITLMDQQRINVQDEHTQYRLQWEELNIYHNKKQPDDRPIDHSLTELLEEHRATLFKSAMTYGFHVCSKYDQKTTTHCYMLHTQQHPYEPSRAELLALCHKKIFITKPWIDGLNTNDKGFNLTDYNSSAKTIEIDNWGPLKRTALLGPNNRRKELFSSMDFWFFDEKQHNEYKELIELCGGKSELHTFEDGLTSDLSEECPLFVIPEPANPEFDPVADRYNKSEEARCIVGCEIYLAIVYMATNYCCNPNTNIQSMIDPNSSYSASFSNSVKVKEEPVDIHDQPTVAAPQTYAYSGIGEVDMHDRPTVAADIHDWETIPSYTIDYVAPRIKEETIESTMDDYDDYKDPAWTNQDTQSHPSAQQGGSVIQQGGSSLQSTGVQQSGNSSSAQDFHTAQQEQYDQQMQENHDIDQPMEDIVVPNPLSELPEEEMLDDMKDMGDFFGDIISTQPKNAAKKRAKRLEKERLEKEKKEKEQQEQERVERDQNQRLERLKQQEQERSERQPSEQERKQRELERLERERKEMARRLLEQEREDEEQAAPSQDPEAAMTNNPIEEEPVEEEPAIPTVNTTQEDTYVDDTGMDIDDSQPIQYPEEDGGKFIKVVYAPLVVKPRPSSLPAPTRRQSGVNFKKFVKTRQLQTVNRTDHVTLLTSSQIPRTQQATREVRIENAAEFDPDIMITTARRRVR